MLTGSQQTSLILSLLPRSKYAALKDKFRLNERNSSNEFLFASGLSWVQLCSLAGLDLCCVSWVDLSSVSPCLKASVSGKLLGLSDVVDAKNVILRLSSATNPETKSDLE